MEAIYLQPILQFRDYWALGYEGKEFAFDCERHWHDQAHEDNHLGHQQEKDLGILVSLHISMEGKMRRTRL